MVYSLMVVDFYSDSIIMTPAGQLPGSSSMYTHPIHTFVSAPDRHQSEVHLGRPIQHVIQLAVPGHPWQQLVRHWRPCDCLLELRQLETGNVRGDNKVRFPDLHV